MIYFSWITSTHWCVARSFKPFLVGSIPTRSTKTNRSMRLLDLFEDADDEIIARLKAIARRDVVPLFHPKETEIKKEMRAFLDPSGEIIAAWPRDAMITHAEMGDYHGRQMKTMTPMAQNIYNCVSLRPPTPLEIRMSHGTKLPTLYVKNDNLADNRWQTIPDYLKRYSHNMRTYRPLHQDA